MNIIDFENIYTGYDTELVLEAVTLKIREGEHWAILGANGSGKSTLMKLMQSDMHPRHTHPFKKEIMGKSRYVLADLKKQLGIITNDLHNYFAVNAPYLSGYEVALSGFYSSVGIFKHQDFSEQQHEKAEQTLAFLEISHLKEKKVHAMSTGELRKCLVARALVHDPKAFILDEPTVGLDIKAQINFIQMLKKLSKNCTIILVTHHLEEIFEEITHVGLMYNKTLYKSGPKQEILTSGNLSEIFETDLKINEKNGRYYIEEVKL